MVYSLEISKLFFIILLHMYSEAAETFLEASSSSVPASPSIVVESDGGSQASGCTSRASVDEDEEVPVTDIYFVSPPLLWSNNMFLIMLWCIYK